MARETSEQPPFVAPRRRLPAAIALACCALAAPSIPAAAARLGHTRTIPDAPAPNGPVAPGPVAPPTIVTAPEPAHQGRVGRHVPTRLGAREQPDTSHQTQVPPTLPVYEQPVHQGERGSDLPGAEDPRQRTPDWGGRHKRVGGPAAATGSPLPLPDVRGRAALHADPSTTTGTAASVPNTPTGVPIPNVRLSIPTVTVTATATAKPATATPAAVKPAAAAPAAPAAATPAAIAPTVATQVATAPAAVTSTPAATPQPLVVGTSQPAGAHRSDPHGRGNAHTHRRHTRSTAAGTHAASVAPSGAVASSAAVSSAHAHAARVGPTRKALRGTARASSPTPIVTTITKIVGVVPTLVWALIGGLLALVLALGVRSRLAALRARRLERQRGELLEDVGLLQAALLPVAPERLGPVGTSAAYRPADGPGAGGDFYDLFALEDGRLAVILGDVSGHGRQALPHTALVRFTLRAYLEAGLSPRSAVQTAGAVLERQLGESFATVAAAIYHPRERTLTYACAGHPPPVVLGSRAIEPITVCSAPPIGAGTPTGTRQTVVSVPGRSRICFHTDGVTEARVGAELFGAQRLTRTLAELGPRATAPELLERVAAQTDSRPDDMAACLLSVEGGEGAPRVLVEELELDREQAASDRIEPFLLACGVPRGEIAELVSSARIVAERSGSALLELRLTDGAPEVTLRRDNVALLHPPQVRRRAGGGAAR